MQLDNARRYLELPDFGLQRPCTLIFFFFFRTAILRYDL
jgi:hypothetical protein